ncbi:MAG: phosphoribosylamine--glycine ligase [Anaerolineae bacterium]|nr:phosphoribosylamine--glycine ligase [Anaerolineae bacterium]
MDVLIVGSGGREHALAWKLRQSPGIDRLYVAPGNAGTAALAENLPVSAEDVDGLLAAARQRQIGLTVVGPEAPLAAGLSDRFSQAGLAVFGPSQRATQIEADKAFAKDLMARHGIPTAAYCTFREYEPALAYARRAPYPLVVKATGLAAGKGVTVCRELPEAEEALRRAMVEREFGAAGDQVLIEECLSGQEASVLAFSDGRAVRPMIVAQDHKALLDGDRGPNTGGMGSYAPAPIVSPALLEEITATILQPAVDGLRAEGIPYRGVLYAGLMLTSTGPQVLEFNARFGDPEAQAILPLLQGDLLPVLLACTDGSLERVDLRWSSRHCLCVVVASPGYPGHYPRGLAISGLEEAATLPDTIIFHAGTRVEQGRVVTSGGRVLGVTGLGDTLAEAAGRAYRAAELVHFEGMYYRRDIGAKAMSPAYGGAH